MSLFGPIHLVVLGFDAPTLPGEVLAQLRALREAGVIRLVDAVWVAKNHEGDLTERRTTDLDQEDLDLLGTLAGALFGFGADGEAGIKIGAEAGWVAAESGEIGLSSDDILETADLIPRGSSAAFLLVEHRWALGLKGAVLEQGGSVIAQGFVTPQSFIAMGEQAARELEYGA